MAGTGRRPPRKRAHGEALEPTEAGSGAPASTAADVRRVATALPEAVELETWGSATFRVRNRIFAILSSHGDQVVIKATREEQSLLLASDPETFSYADYVGRFGWVGVRLATVEPAVLKALLTDAWRSTAPKRVAARLVEE
jgi:hypothetical protein